MTIQRFVFWAPRILTILFAVFLSIFALDVFGETAGFWKTTGALLMHLIPTALILLVLAVAWRREGFGVIVFTILGVFYIVTTWGRFPLSVYFTIAGPMFLLALLFLANWIQRRQVGIR